MRNENRFSKHITVIDEGSLYSVEHNIFCQFENLFRYVIASIIYVIRHRNVHNY